METPCNELGNVNLSEQSWPQLTYWASYELHAHNFREWFYKKL